MPRGTSAKGDKGGFVGEGRTGSSVGLGGQGLTSNIDCLFLDLNTCWLEGAVCVLLSSCNRQVRSGIGGSGCFHNYCIR